MLIVNPFATTTSRRTRDVIATALAADCKLEVVETQGRDHACRLARQAAYDGLDAVVALGGDGTVNEVVNGLLADGPSAGLPSLGVVPGGHTNVLARSLGLPRDPVDATSVALDAMRSGRRRRIGLARADERWFTFCAGLGLDAEVIARIEEHRAAGGRASAARYVATTVREFFLSARRRPAPLTLEPDDGPAVDGVHVALVMSTSPWTYIGDRTVDPCPAASFDTGLDVFALTGLGVPSTLRHAWRMLSGTGTAPRGRHVVSLHDCPGLTLRAREPLAFQVDGDHLGPRTTVRLTAVPDALGILQGPVG